MRVIQYGIAITLTLSYGAIAQAGFFPTRPKSCESLFTTIPGLKTGVGTYGYRDQIPDSARRLMIAGGKDILNYHANAVDFILLKSATNEAKTSVLILVRADDVIAPALKKALKRRFENLSEESIYTDVTGKPHEILALSDRGNGFERPAAEYLIIMARDEVMRTVQDLQGKNKAGIMYSLTYATDRKNTWFNSDQDGFRVPLRGGSDASDW